MARMASSRIFPLPSHSSTPACSANVDTYMYMFNIYIHTYIHTCIHLYIYIYMYICIYVYTHTRREKLCITKRKGNVHWNVRVASMHHKWRWNNTYVLDHLSLTHTHRRSHPIARPPRCLASVDTYIFKYIHIHIHIPYVSALHTYTKCVHTRVPRTVWSSFSCSRMGLFLPRAVSQELGHRPLLARVGHPPSSPSK